MLGAKTFTVSLLLASATFSAAQTASEYFPLQPGGSWAYRVAEGRLETPPQTISVLGLENARDKEYTRVNVLNREVLLRSEGGAIHVFNTAAGTEAPWIRFDAPDGESFPVQIDSCTSSARIESRAATIETPVGLWNNAIHFTFQQSCADAGLTDMYFVPSIGIAAYETTSIAGPSRYALTYARAGYTTVEAPQTSFTASLDASSYKTAAVPSLHVRLTLRSAQPVTLQFPSGQRFDARIWNDRGEVTYAWSADKLFPAVIGSEKVGPGERTFAFTVNPPNLPVGRYVAEVWLTTSNREYVGHVGFEVTQ